eukprot:TRINITY_DN2409_c0_g1_i11.p5 TRINITY_DN2409_c0_g1~~TRINITY_DN2409_c0_g1_i11.p5  ORF type:complete len:130 (+),score=38.80 TRINITY_DN2409_c0_g1_i11:1-390(+)
MCIRDRSWRAQREPAGRFFFFQAEDGIRDRSPSRGLGDVYKRQTWGFLFEIYQIYISKRDTIKMEEEFDDILKLEERFYKEGHSQGKENKWRRRKAKNMVRKLVKVCECGTFIDEMFDEYNDPLSKDRR